MGLKQFCNSKTLVLIQSEHEEWLVRFTFYAGKQVESLNRSYTLNVAVLG